MTYKHLNTQELTFIYHFWKQGTKAYLAARALRRSAETIYRVYRFLNQGKTIVQSCYWACAHCCRNACHAYSGRMIRPIEPMYYLERVSYVCVPNHRVSAL